MRWLLIQFRDPGDVMLAHERECFLHHTGIPEPELVCDNVLERSIDSGRLGEFDGYFMGGSGAYALSGKRHPAIDDFVRFVPEIVSWNKPVFGACFGLHVLIEGLGGRIGLLDGRLELGTYRMRLTDDGAADPVFGRLPREFDAQMGHHDWVLSMPPDSNVAVLVDSESSSCQAIRVGDGPIYATQFHPELSREELGHRLRVYDSSYTAEGDDVESIIAAFRPTPECLTLLPRFVEAFGDRGTA